MNDTPAPDPTGRFARLDALFEEAVDLDEPQRAALVERVRRDDSGLADELVDLLRWDAREGSPLDDAVHGAVASILDRAGPDRRGARLGPYRLIDELGHGGMGTVYLAERDDDAYEARVAIKLIRGGVASREQIRRFRGERQILASLNHPNIARLLDGGTTPDGLPYVVMEVVEGEPIDQFCDRERLSIRDRLQLFRSVCDAVSYAHRNLVVHRDLKPGNILVTADGVPKLLDFGIAKLLEPDAAEGDGGAREGARTVVAMTPAYASPEQVRGESVTTATDVYALGAVLYELLTGHPAHRFDTRSPGEIERVICEEGPDRPSTVVTRALTSTREGTAGATPDELGGARRTDPARLRHTLSGDLDTILLMALRKEPDRRYASVEAFSQDLVRYLDGLPVRARGEAWSYLTSKFVARHRAAVASGAAGLALVVGLVGFYTARVAGERDRARIEAAKAETMADFLGGLFSIEERTPAAGAAVTARELLDRGTATIAELDDPEVRSDLEYVMGLAYGNLGLYEQATPLLESAEATTRDLRGPDDPETSAVRSALANSLYDQGDYAASDSVLRAALPGFEGHPDQYTATLSNRGRSLMRLGRHEEARTLYEEALARYGTMDGDQRMNRGTVLGQLGQIALSLDDRDAAEAYLRQAVIIDRELDAEGAGNLATNLQSLASVLVSRRELAEAEGLLRESLALDEERLGPDHPGLAATLTTLGDLHVRMGDSEGGEPYLRRAVELGRRGGEDHPDLAYDVTSLAMLLTETGDLDEAETLSREAIRMTIATEGEASPFVARARLGLGVALRDQGRLGEAEAALDTAVAGAEAVLPEGHSFTANLWMNRGKIRAQAGDRPGAESDLSRAYEVHRDTYGADDARTQSIADALADLYEAWGRSDEAAQWRASGAG